MADKVETTARRRSNLLEIVIVLLIIAGCVVFVTSLWHNHESRQRDTTRKQLVNDITANLERFYVADGRGFYPSAADLQSSSWLHTYMSDVAADNFKAARGPIKQSYALQYTSRDTSETCTNEKPDMSNAAGCADFTVSIQLENGSRFIVTSLNGQ